MTGPEEDKGRNAQNCAKNEEDNQALERLEVKAHAETQLFGQVRFVEPLARAKPSSCRAKIIPCLNDPLTTLLSHRHLRSRVSHVLLILHLGITKISILSVELPLLVHGCLNFVLSLRLSLINETFHDLAAQSPVSVLHFNVRVV